MEPIILPLLEYAAPILAAMRARGEVAEADRIEAQMKSDLAADREYLAQRNSK